ncbi:outer membrane protein transport protein [Chitinibacter bivalviorum]|uniref:Outer membrane protein transport protein n=1 Tax=Chitinibacter bivalviorum TaxID=2739434 RepID=A0A7H9BID3_9NEIS|nr:outer membrane protein transport protein [Chitinibacter bivalviorum]QLG88036.1 outer membrane protein transport protein [Chitinibacter bivalviorum]
MKFQSSILLLALCTGTTWAGGIYLYEVGTEDVGLAGAGMAARAQDPSVMMTNPAGLSMLKGDQITIGAQALYGDVQYRPQIGADADNVIGWFPGMSAFYSHSINDQLTVGLGLYGNYGLAMDFGHWGLSGPQGNDLGSSLIKNGATMALTFQPSVAYRINDQWSIGASLGINYGYAALTRDTLLGAEEKTSNEDWALNAKLGVLYQYNESTRFGLAYTSATQYNFDLNPSILGQQTLVTQELNAPQQIMFSAFHQLSPRWAVMGNVGWQDWSAYNQNKINGAQVSQQFQDTWHSALGVQYQWNEKLRLNTGVAYDSSFYQDQHNASLALPSGAAWRFGAGAVYQLDKKSSVGLALEYMHVDDATVQNIGPLNGQYDSPQMFFISANYQTQF